MSPKRIVGGPSLNAYWGIYSSTPTAVCPSRGLWSCVLVTGGALERQHIGVHPRCLFLSGIPLRKVLCHNLVPRLQPRCRPESKDTRPPRHYTVVHFTHPLVPEDSRSRVGYGPIDHDVSLWISRSQRFSLSISESDVSLCGPVGPTSLLASVDVEVSNDLQPTAPGPRSTSR